MISQRFFTQSFHKTRKFDNKKHNFTKLKPSYFTNVTYGPKHFQTILGNEFYGIFTAFEINRMYEVYPIPPSKFKICDWCHSTHNTLLYCGQTLGTARRFSQGKKQNHLDLSATQLREGWQQPVSSRRTAKMFKTKSMESIKLNW